MRDTQHSGTWEATQHSGTWEATQHSGRRGGTPSTVGEEEGHPAQWDEGHPAQWNEGRCTGRGEEGRCTGQVRGGRAGYTTRVLDHTARSCGGGSTPPWVHRQPLLLGPASTADRRLLLDDGALGSISQNMRGGGPWALLLFLVLFNSVSGIPASFPSHLTHQN